jgi:branched-chain amino acid aminotransferase
MNAVKNGKMEGIMLTTDGYVAEGSGENLFLVKDDTLYTAPSGSTILPGITRSSVIALAEDRGYTVEEKRIPREELYLADELFFTGTAAEVTPIRTVDDYEIGPGTRGPITKELQDAFFDVVRGGNDPHDWLTFVDVPEAEITT